MAVTSAPEVRKRRPNVAGGRTKPHQVKVSAEEEAVIAVAAQEQGVTWVRFVVEAAMAVAAAGDELAVETPTARRARMAELFVLQGQVAELALQVRRAGVNLNQLARGMHMGAGVPIEELRRFLADEQAHLQRARVLYDQIGEAIAGLAAAGVRS